MLHICILLSSRQFLIERIEKGNLGPSEKEMLLKTVKVVTASISKLKREVEVATFSAVPASKAALLKKEVHAFTEGMNEQMNC